MISPQYVSRVSLNRAAVESFDRYPFSLPAVHSLEQIDIHPKVTCFVGENGSGKSTMLEAIAVSLGRPWAVGRKNWLFAGSMAAAQRAADIMSLIESAKLNGIEPAAYLRDVLTKLPTHPNSPIAELLPTHWKPAPVA